MRSVEWIRRKLRPIHNQRGMIPTVRLTLYSDYSLRVLMFLGVKEDGFGTIEEIAQHYDVSRNHLMKVVHGLGQRGYIDTLRGKHGGMYLRQPAHAVNLGTLIRETEQDFALAECFRQDNRCVITPACKLRHVLNEALQAFLAVLDRYTLADLLVNEAEMRSLLDIESAPVRWGRSRDRNA